MQALWMPVFAELYAAELPLLVPGPEYLAELPCGPPPPPRVEQRFPYDLKYHPVQAICSSRLSVI